jgi:hypothetical protein
VETGGGRFKLGRGNLGARRKAINEQEAMSEK